MRLNTDVIVDRIAETLLAPGHWKKPQHLKVKIEVICEATYLKKSSDVLKDLSKKS
jgi:hypothetical protein